MGSKCQIKFDNKSLYTNRVYFFDSTVEIHPKPCTVTACGQIKKFKGGDFFYGKASNENNLKRL